MPSLYRKAAFVAVGLSNFTQQAFLKRQSHFADSLSQQDMSGRVMAVTGANGGIGLEAARAFLLQHGHVHIICRDKGRGEKARDELIADYNSKHPSPPPTPLSSLPRVQLHLVDLSSIAQTKAFCRAFSRSQQPLHVLVNNAGCMVHKRTMTAEGLELNFATNVAGTYTITEELLPVLRRCNSPDYVSRVITVSSGGMLTEDLEVDDLQSERVPDGDALYIYAQNKRQQVVLTEAWQRREAATATATTPCVVFHAMHPGWADTPGVQVAMGDFYHQVRHPDSLDAFFLFPLPVLHHLMNARLVELTRVSSDERQVAHGGRGRRHHRLPRLCAVHEQVEWERRSGGDEGRRAVAGPGGSQQDAAAGSLQAAGRRECEAAAGQSRQGARRQGGAD